MEKTTNLEIISSLAKGTLDISAIKELDVVNSAFNHKVNKRSIAIDSTIIVATISATSAALGLFISNIFDYFKSKNSRKISIRIKNGDKEINVDLNSDMTPEEIIKYTKNLVMLNDLEVQITEE